MTRIETAQKFAHEAHDSIQQKRKYTYAPYWEHTDDVAHIVASFGGTEDMVVAAHLHDVIEDVFPLKPEYDIYRIAKEFGNTVAGYVTDLTDVYTKEAWPDLNRAKRKALEIERVGNTCAASQTIKVADLIHNTESICSHDPDFALVYLKEKVTLLQKLTRADFRLFNVACKQTLDNLTKLGMLDVAVGLPIYRFSNPT